MKQARRIELYDSGTLMGDGEGIFDEFGQLDRFEVNTVELEKFAKVFDIPYVGYTEWVYNKKEGKEAPRQAGIHHLELALERSLRKFEADLSEIWAEIPSAGLLEMLLVWKGGFRSKITYSGRFAVEWQEED